jgi:hypothetical protein
MNMVTARHENGRITIATANDTQLLEMEAARRLLQELEKALFDCREFMIGS